LIARFLVLSLLTTLAGAASAVQGDELPPEYRVKAQILLRFAERITWPDKAFPDAKSPFKIGILGKDPFGGHIETAIKTQKFINEHPIVLTKDTDPDKLKDCHLVFIAGSEESTLEDALKAFKGRTLLTMSDTPGFCKSGTAINLLLTKGTKGYKTTYELNNEALEASGLKADAPIKKGGAPPKAKDEGP